MRSATVPQAWSACRDLTFGAHRVLARGRQRRFGRTGRAIGLGGGLFGAGQCFGGGAVRGFGRLQCVQRLGAARGDPGGGGGQRVMLGAGLAARAARSVTRPAASSRAPPSRPARRDGAAAFGAAGGARASVSRSARAALSRARAADSAARARSTAARRAAEVGQRGIGRAGVVQRRRGVQRRPPGRGRAVRPARPGARSAEAAWAAARQAAARARSSALLGLAPGGAGGLFRGGRRTFRASACRSRGAGRLGGRLLRRGQTARRPPTGCAAAGEPRRRSGCRHGSCSRPSATPRRHGTPASARARARLAAAPVASSSTSPICDRARASTGRSLGPRRPAAPHLRAGPAADRTAAVRASAGPRRGQRRSQFLPQRGAQRASSPAGTTSESTIGGQRSPSFTASTSASAWVSAAKLGAGDFGVGVRLRARRRARRRPRGSALLRFVQRGTRADSYSSACAVLRRRRRPGAGSTSPAAKTRALLASRAQLLGQPPWPLLRLRQRLQRQTGRVRSPPRRPRWRGWLRASASRTVSAASTASASAARPFGMIRRRPPPARHPRRQAGRRRRSASALSCSACARSLRNCASRPRGLGQRRPRARSSAADLLPRDAVAFQRGARLAFGLRSGGSASAVSAPRRRCRGRTTVAAWPPPARPRAAPPRPAARACSARARWIASSSASAVADRAGYVAVAARLARLAFQRTELGLQLAAQILGARQVRFGGAQLQFRLVPAGVQAGDAGGLLQHRAPFLRPRVDQRADPALADHRRRPRAGREVGEQRLHVPRARLLAVDPVVAAGAAFDPAADLQFRVLVERRRRDALRLVEASASPRRCCATARPAVPAKITSSISPPRRPRALLSPIAQRRASTMLDLPQPFGPTMPVRPGRISTPVGSAKLLNPAMRSRLN